VLGNPLYAVKLGNGNKKVLYSASIHANEWITSLVLMKFIEDYSNAYLSNGELLGHSIYNLFDTTSIYIIPMVNPDGVNLVTGAYDINNPNYKDCQSIASAYPSIPFPSGWKANIRGVDLNLQFPAGWEEARRIKFGKGFSAPAPRDFVGFGPLTEPEALALYDFTLEQNLELVIAFHTQGKEIYWQFQNYAPAEAKELGKVFANVSGYLLTDVPFDSSFAGYKDWFLQEYRRPGYTIEAGFGENPLPLSQFDEIYKDTLGILIMRSYIKPFGICFFHFFGKNSNINVKKFFHTKIAKKGKKEEKTV